MRKISDVLYGEKAHQLMFIWLIASVFTYGLMYRVIDPRTIFWVSIIYCLYELNTKRINPFNISFFLLFETYLLAGIIDYSREPWLNLSWSNLKYAWIYPVVYLLGVMSINGKNNKACEKRAMLTFLAIAFGMLCQGFLDYINKLIEPAWDYLWYSFWGDDYEVRNIFDMSFLPFVSVLFYTATNRKEKPKLFFASAISLLGVIGMTIFWSHGRLVFVTVAVMIIVFLIVRLLRGEIKLSKRAVLCVGLVAICFAIISFILYSLDFMGLQELYHNTFLSRDGGILHNVRFKIHIDAAKKTFLYPLGGWEGIYDNGGTHNAFFEYARWYDTIVFSFLALFFILELVNGLRLLKREKNFALNFMLVSSQIIFMIYFFMEPVGFAYRYYFVFPIFISGIVRGWSIAIDNNGRIRKGELKKYADMPTNIA